VTPARVGLGCDGHPLVVGRRCVIGGVAIPHPSGPVGHSDGDPLLHALADALYGAAGAGDIGVHFPDHDPAHAGADSATFVAHALERVRALGLAVVNVDAVVQCDAPRIGPHRAAMAARIAALCGMAAERVNVKAKSLQAAPGLTGVHAQVVVLLGPA
jgi:2-C-methyl-D-erythritol 2,4-cyclodiphosphate synthase